ncbi:thiolase C-terminal domain-containing protein [Dactylosporangium sp. CS-033363]|uniref:thiolase C-terminal domain-containing protein n=1 Tax=Dactylosporangium sp. CS-033363 TaxID=3239935 RepID=UPI003D93C95F
MTAFPRTAAVAGVGATELSRDSGVPVAALATRAVLAALADAGMTVADVDAVIDYQVGDSVSAVALAKTLGVGEFGWVEDVWGGGQHAASILGRAAMLVDSGAARTVVVYRALNGRSGRRMGQVAVGQPGEEQFYGLYGLAGPPQLFALAARRFLHDRGTGADDLAAVAIQMRTHAMANPGALMREPLDRAGYDASPFVAEPLRRLDCCQETDGACALVVTGLDRARGGPHPAVTIRAVTRGGGPGSSTQDRATDLGALFSRYLAGRLWAAAGLGPGDIDLAQLYDAYTWVVLGQLEDFGFAERGGAGDLIRAGGATHGGRIPLNLNGGLLSEGYVHGFNNVVEAVRQLRHEAAGRQVRDAATALVTGFSGSFGSAAVLQRSDA